MSPKNLSQNLTNHINRRRFVKGALAGIALPYFIPEGVLAAPGRPGANDRIRIANIGVGGMGSGHVREDAVALCDADANHLANAAKKVKGTPFLTDDYRRVLDRDDVDAVMIATPDHWHALMTVHACQAGKDVYSEKPTCRTIHEGLAMVNTARRYGRVVQIGAQGRSGDVGRRAAQFVRNGQLGRVPHVEVWHENNYTGGSWKTEPVPANLNWDMWLGPAPWRPYNPSIVHFNFRWIMDFGGGFIRDRGNHVLSIVKWATGSDAQDPVSVEATGQRSYQSPWDVPVTMDVKWEFKNPDWTLTWQQPGTRHPLPSTGQPIAWGAKFHGERDSLIFAGGDGYGDTEAKAKVYVPPSNGVNIPQSPGHRENWLDCIRTRQKPVMDVEIGYQVIKLPILGNIAYQLGRKLYWDAAKQEFIGDAEANRFLHEPYRGPWTL